MWFYYLLNFKHCIIVEPVQPVPSYVPGGGLNAIQEDSEMEEKETASKHESEESAAKSQPPPPPHQLFTEPKALSLEDVEILSESILYTLW